MAGAVTEDTEIVELGMLSLEEYTRRGEGREVEEKKELGIRARDYRVRRRWARRFVSLRT